MARVFEVFSTMIVMPHRPFIFYLLFYKIFVLEFKVGGWKKIKLNMNYHTKVPTHLSWQEREHILFSLIYFNNLIWKIFNGFNHLPFMTAYKSSIWNQKTGSNNWGRLIRGSEDSGRRTELAMFTPEAASISYVLTTWVH